MPSPGDNLSDTLYGNYCYLMLKSEARVWAESEDGSKASLRAFDAAA